MLAWVCYCRTTLKKRALERWHLSPFDVPTFGLALKRESVESLGASRVLYSRKAPATLTGASLTAVCRLRKIVIIDSLSS